MKDSIELFDGNTSTSPSIAKLSGQLSDLDSTVFKTSGSSLLIVFESDGMLASKGFKANFTFGNAIGTTTSTAPSTSASTIAVTNETTTGK